ncbi:MAG: hypothetical protein APF77_03610 [Clostridia bacterium BRH_c25]|nr:MAG: hypothetical protein APF77_03610 [Clostridia bacterium BRH_c25]
MAHRFDRGLYSAPKSIPIEVPSKKPEKNDELLILILLLILLAASPSLGLESRYFFIIIMAVIGLGGVEKAFGLNK